MKKKILFDNPYKCSKKAETVLFVYFTEEIKIKRHSRPKGRPPALLQAKRHIKAGLLQATVNR